MAARQRVYENDNPSHSAVEETILATAAYWASGLEAVGDDDRPATSERRKEQLADLEQLERALALDGGSRPIPDSPQLVHAVRTLPYDRRPCVRMAVRGYRLRLERLLAQSG